jgi:hypothetical protein
MNTSRLSKKIELIANLAIIVVAVLLIGSLIKNYMMPARKEISGGIPLGSKILIPDIDWASNGQTLLLALQKDCHFCTESAPFYQRLVRETSGYSNVRLVAVLPNVLDEGKQYLNHLGISINEVRQAALDSIGVDGTPTLILVDGNGKVEAAWVGRLSANREEEVLKRLQVSSVGNN